MVLVTMRKLLKFILLKMVFSICDTLRKIRKSSRSFSRAANRADEEPWKRKKNDENNNLSNWKSILICAVLICY